MVNKAYQNSTANWYNSRIYSRNRLFFFSIFWYDGAMTELANGRVSGHQWVRVTTAVVNTARRSVRAHDADEKMT